MLGRKSNRLLCRALCTPLMLFSTMGAATLVPIVALAGGAVVALTAPAWAQGGCVIGPAKAGAGFSVDTFVSGLPYNSNLVDQQFGVSGGSCIGPWGIAFTGSTAYVTTSGDPGGLFRFGATGGPANVAHTVDSMPFQGAPVFDRGHFYVIENSPDPGHATVVEADPQNGVTMRTIATGLDCPQYLVADPVNGDLFTQDGCSGWPSSSAIEEIVSPASSRPTLRTYANVTGSPLMGAIAFAPDGVLYVITGYGIVASVPPGGGRFVPLFKQSAVPALAPGATAVAVAKTSAGGHATSLWITVFSDADHDASQLYLVNLASKSPTAQLALTAGGSGSHLMSVVVGPHGCVYATSTSTILRVSTAGQTCT